MDNNFAIKINNLSKEYKKSDGNSFLALDDVSLLIEEGSFLGLLGPNGAGKSTLINILSGLTVKTGGKVHIMNLDLDSNSTDIKYLLGVVPQEVILDIFSPIGDALEFYAGYYGIRPENRKTDQILSAMGLLDKKMAPPRQLSGGMKRRFLIAKAMVHSPPIIILDEPTAGVDVELRNQLWDYIVKLNKKGITIILTTHYLAEAESLCSDIAFINNGKIICKDSKENIINKYGNKKFLIHIEEDKLPNDLQKKLNLKLNKNTIVVDKGNHNSFNDIINEIQSYNLHIKDIDVQKDNLEDIFKKIMYV